MENPSIQHLAEQAARLLDAGRFDDAVVAHERLLERDPDRPNSWYNLGWLRRQTRQFEGALVAYGEALARGGASPAEIHLNRGVILAADLGRADEAEVEILQALEIKHDFVEALLNLGGLHEDRGDRKAAEEAYGKALSIDPKNALALTRLAGVTHFKSADDPLIGALRAAVLRPGASPLDCADLGFALGRALDSARAFALAFEAYAAANEANKIAGGGVRYEPADHEKRVNRLIAAFPTANIPSPELERPSPLFICGMFRSGSTLAERILARHPEVTAGGELAFIPALIGRQIAGYPEAAGEADIDAIRRWRDLYFQGLDEVHPGASLVSDKRPDNFLHIGLIKRIFPDAKIIHTVRDPRDTALSVYFAHLDPRLSYALDLKSIAHWYSEYRRLMAHWKSLWPNDIFDFDYDALITDPEPRISELLKFCGFDWDAACLEPHAANNLVRTASAWQVREPLYNTSSGRWHNYEEHLGALKNLPA